MEIRTRSYIEKTVEVATPYYYEHDLDSCVIYGKIEPQKTTTISIPKTGYGEKEYSLSVDKSLPDGSYLHNKYKGSEWSWRNAASEFREFCLESLD
jgi:hypothetical protein